MPFVIPNSADALVAGQAAPDSGDFAILAAGLSGTGVLSGCAVTPSSGLVLSVAAGIVSIAGKAVTVASGTVTVTTAHATYDRYDLVVVNSSGTKSVTKGPEQAVGVFPAIPASSVVLAAVYVAHTDTVIASNEITDKRVMLVPNDDFLAYIYR